jgi:hypothetical protein
MKNESKDTIVVKKIWKGMKLLHSKLPSLLFPLVDRGSASKDRRNEVVAVGPASRCGKTVNPGN